ncbi:phosphoglycerate mutase [Mesorhizobium sp. L-8-10]|uniref:histidine phosphatase family protein n=1 Tax=unclassified Mesorhizobium TaxID=325217 RepID=UPI001926DC12|nr:MULTISPECIES: histidine phosphatase family protein [unclassified Mesorhizobium]BCH24418.1 phosphoglycerate mutase [Mesorhizobium sp. L-8-3]BCH32153.1 phosphoglycerate mutase [Mesorhizobium sp. L-8-10]
MFRVAAALILLVLATAAEATEAGWALLRDGGHVVLLRHAMTAGSADPAKVDLDDCRSQRNLSERGRQQARKMGALFAARAAGIELALASRYCRTMETARLAFGERPTEAFEALDVPSSDPTEAEAQKAAVMKEISGFRGSGNMVMVTHLENITALTGQSAREGEALIVRPDGETLHVLGRIVFN